MTRRRNRLTRRAWLKEVGAAGASSVLVPRALAPEPVSAQSAPAQQLAQSDGTIMPKTSTSDVFVPPRGRGFQKFSFDFPEPSVAFDGYEFGFRVFTHENTYGLSMSHLAVRPIERGLELTCTELIWAGGQQRSAGRVTARLTKRETIVDCDVDAAMDRPIKALAMILRGVPRGRLSAGGAPFFDPHDDEVLLGYPFSGGDLIGPQGNGGLTTPLVFVQPADGRRLPSRPSTIACAPSASISSPETTGTGSRRSSKPKAGIRRGRSTHRRGGSRETRPSPRPPGRTTITWRGRSTFRDGTLDRTCPTGFVAPRSWSRCTGCTTPATCSTTMRECSPS